MLTVTGANVAEVLDLRWQEIWELSEDGGSERLCDFRSGPHSLRLEPEEIARVFGEDFTTERLYKFWVRTRAEAGPHSVGLHNARHSYASQGVMNGVGLTAVGKLIRRRNRATTATYAPLVYADNAPLRDAAAQAETVIARAMGYRAAQPPVLEETGD